MDDYYSRTSLGFGLGSLWQSEEVAGVRVSGEGGRLFVCVSKSHTCEIISIYWETGPKGS